LGNGASAESAIKTRFNFIGIEKFHEIAIEYQEFGGELLAQSIQAAEQKTIALVQDLQH
jgi:FMN-dependent NADH-azoreductase